MRLLREEEDRKLMARLAALAVESEDEDEEEGKEELEHAVTPAAQW